MGYFDGPVEGVRPDYGDKRDYKKINIFWRGEYRASTTWAATCREAKAAFLHSKPNLVAAEVKCFFDKESKK